MYIVRKTEREIERKGERRTERKIKGARDTREYENASSNYMQRCRCVYISMNERKRKKTRQIQKDKETIRKREGDRE